MGDASGEQRPKACARGAPPVPTPIPDSRFLVPKFEEHQMQGPSGVREMRVLFMSRKAPLPPSYTLNRHYEVIMRCRASLEELTLQ
jgi:hypothetical protein